MVFQLATLITQRLDRLPAAAPMSNWGSSSTVLRQLHPATPKLRKCKPAASDALAAKSQDAPREHAAQSKLGSCLPGVLRQRPVTSYLRECKPDALVAKVQGALQGMQRHGWLRGAWPSSSSGHMQRCASWPHGSRGDRLPTAGVSHMVCLDSCQWHGHRGCRACNVEGGIAGGIAMHTQSRSRVVVRAEHSLARSSRKALGWMSLRQRLRPH